MCEGLNSLRDGRSRWGKPPSPGDSQRQIVGVLLLLRLLVSSRSRLRYSVRPRVSNYGTCSTGRAARGLPAFRTTSPEGCSCPLGHPVRESSTISMLVEASPRPREGHLSIARQYSPTPCLDVIFSQCRCLPVGPCRRLGRRVDTVPVRRSAAPCNVRDDRPSLRQHLQIGVSQQSSSSISFNTFES
jgi:hypothetical protein